MKRALLSLLAVPVLLLASGCEEKPVQPPSTVVNSPQSPTSVVYPPLPPANVVYPGKTPAQPVDLTPVGEGMKVLAIALVAVSVVIGVVVVLRARINQEPRS